MEDGTPEAIKKAMEDRFVNAIKVDTEVTWDGCCQDLAVVTTIIDNDLILVLGNGEVLEYGTPAELISRNGALSQMVDDTGEELSRELRRRANASKNS